MLQLHMLRLDAISDARWAAIIKALRRVVARRGVDRADVDDVIQTSLEKALRRGEHACRRRSARRLAQPNCCKRSH